MTKNFFLPIFFLTIFSSCSFNKIFLYPEKAPNGPMRVINSATKDTTLIFFSPESHQPTFTNNGRDTLELNYIIESVVFKSTNGNKLNAWLIKPKNKKPTVTLLHLHGNAGFLLSQYQIMLPLVKENFQVFLFDYSGFGFSEGKATKRNVLIDAHSALNYLKSRADISETKLVIYGQSLGGHLSAVLAAQREKDVDGLVIEGAFSSHKDIAADKIPVLGRVFVKQGYRATKSIKDFHKPVLIIHSNQDKVIPFIMGKKIFDKANSPKEFYEIEHTHILGPIYYSAQISQKIKKMLEEN